MELQEFLNLMERRERVVSDSEAHRFMSASAFEVMELTAKLNSGCHSLGEIQELFSQIIGKPVDETFALFPPFYTDCGKNTTIGKNVFINSCCHFQDQGGIVIGDGSLIGHNVTLATLNHGMAPQQPQYLSSAHHRLPLTAAPLRTQCWYIQSQILPTLRIQVREPLRMQMRKYRSVSRKSKPQ